MVLDKSTSQIHYPRTNGDDVAELRTTGMDDFAAELGKESNIAGLARYEGRLAILGDRVQPFYSHTEADIVADRASEAAFDRLDRR